MDILKYKIIYTLILLNLIIWESHCQLFPSLPRFLDPRIIGGEKARLEDAQHIVSIRLKMKELTVGFGAGHICGGTLVRDNLVITASHCLINIESDVPILRHFTEFTVVMGILNLYDNDVTKYLQFDVKTLVHKQFAVENFRNDIALMYLKGNVPKNHPHIVPIPLAKDTPAKDTKCQVLGWGATRVGGSANQYLMQLMVPLLNTQQCSSYYKQRIQDGMMCAGFMEGGKDSCQGDSGGPLVCNKALVGVVSWGEKCALPNFPGVYTNVSHFSDWIQENLNDTKQADYGSLQYFATIRLKYVEATNPGMGIIASGALINANTFLTTAHSLYYPSGILISPEHLTVVFSGDRMEADPIQFDVKDIKIHENFDIETKSNNIAFLQFSKNVSDAQGLSTINIANISSDNEAHKKCITLGFNTHTTTNNDYGVEVKIFGADDVLYSSSVKVFPRDKCRSKYSNRLRHDEMCAGNIGELQDENQPEDGGPLVCNSQLVGLAYNRSSFAFKDFPSKYVDVFQHRPWILKTSGSSSIYYGFKILPLIFIFMLSFYL